MSQSDMYRHESNLDQVLDQMKLSIWSKQLNKGIVQCRSCGESWKGDNISATSHLHYLIETTHSLTYENLCCNHYVCRFCLNIPVQDFIEQLDRRYQCSCCGEDIEWFIRQLANDPDFWDDDGLDDYLGSVQQDIDSDAETEAGD